MHFLFILALHVLALVLSKLFLLHFICWHLLIRCYLLGLLILFFLEIIEIGQESIGKCTLRCE